MCKTNVFLVFCIVKVENGGLEIKTNKGLAFPNYARAPSSLEFNTSSLSYYNFNKTNYLT